LSFAPVLLPAALNFRFSLHYARKSFSAVSRFYRLVSRLIKNKSCKILISARRQRFCGFFSVSFISDIRKKLLKQRTVYDSRFTIYNLRFTIHYKKRMKILIIKLSSIGDVVHTLPALAAIRRALPDAEIAWAVERRAAEILRGNKLIDNLIEIDTRPLRKGKTIEETLIDTAKQLRELRSFKFDAVLDFQGLLKSAAVAKLAKARRTYGFSKQNLREPASRFLLTDTVEVEPNSHIIIKNLTLAQKVLKIPRPENDFEFPIFTDETHKQEAEKIVEQSGENFAILNPAGGWTTKLWHTENFGALADRLWKENRLTSVVTTAPNETELAQKVLQNSKSGKVLLAQPSLRGFYELAKKAKIYVGGDTAPTHLAVAAKTPIVGIFGPTEWRRNGSPNTADICVDRTDIGCRADCHRRTCDNWICMDIEVETVLQAAQKRLKSASKI
jgi:heptosyltransferase-1